MITTQVPVAANGRKLACLIDVEDLERLGKRRLSLGSHGYVQMWASPGVVLLHRWILSLERGDRRIGDHINGNPLDNRRSNLRIVTTSGSSQNVAGRGASKYRGVYQERDGKWGAKVKFQGEVYRLGVFASESAAAIAADLKRRELMPDYVGVRIESTSHGAPDRRTMANRLEARKRATAIRKWARANGFDVPERGRVPTAVLRAYDEAHL